MSEGDGDDRQVEVGHGTEGVSGEDAEAAGVGGDARVERNLHGKVGDLLGAGGDGMKARIERHRGKDLSQCNIGW
jgi:hypothetical protein